MRVFFATDIHGSEVCWRKFLNAGQFYGADTLISRRWPPRWTGRSARCSTCTSRPPALAHDRPWGARWISELSATGSSGSGSGCAPEQLLERVERSLIDRAVGILDRAMSMAEARSGITAGG